MRALEPVKARCSFCSFCSQRKDFYMNEVVFYEFLKEGFYAKKCDLWFILDLVFLALIYYIITFPYHFIKYIIEKIRSV